VAREVSAGARCWAAHKGGGSELVSEGPKEILKKKAFAMTMSMVLQFH